VVAPGESARLKRVPAFGPSPAVARVVSLRSTPRATAPLPSWNRVERRTGRMAPIEPKDCQQVGGSSLTALRKGNGSVSGFRFASILRSVGSGNGGDDYDLSL
jgi:hypothetical protein